MAYLVSGALIHVLDNTTTLYMRYKRKFPPVPTKLSSNKAICLFVYLFDLRQGLIQFRLALNFRCS